MNNIFFQRVKQMLAERARMIYDCICGKILPAINWKKIWRVDSIEKKEVMQIKERGLTNTVLLRKDKGNLKGFQAIFETWLSWRCFL